MKWASRSTLPTYSLEFLPSALKELGGNVRAQFRKKLEERLANPRVPSAKLRDLSECYKIKLRAAGFRLVYRVEDHRLVVTVVTVGRRDRNLVYKIAAGRVV